MHNTSSQKIMRRKKRIEYLKKFVGFLSATIGLIGIIIFLIGNIIISKNASTGNTAILIGIVFMLIAAFLWTIRVILK